MTGDAVVQPAADSVAQLIELISSSALITDGSNNNVNINNLRRKRFLLVFSGLGISDRDISIVKDVYNRTNNYKILWIPIVKQRTWTPYLTTEFESVRAKMPWYAVKCSNPTPPGIGIIKSTWNFNCNTRVGLMNTQGRVLTAASVGRRGRESNAFPLIKNKGLNALGDFE